MARLVGWLRGIGLIGIQRLTGPRTVGSAATESVMGRVQTVSSVFGVWRYQFSFGPMREGMLRKYRGLVTALHGGANAVRVPFSDPDVMSWQEAGINLPSGAPPSVPFDNGMPFDNGRLWQLTRPSVPVSGSAAKGATIIHLANQHWGHGLLGGEWIGFFPFHFGKYEVTQVFDEPGRYRIWPPLRKAIAATDYATLDPVMAMRLEGEGAATVGRGAVVAEGMTMTLIEVEDADVRDYFAD